MPESMFSRQLRSVVWSMDLAHLEAEGVSEKMTRTKAWRRSSYGNYAPERGRPVTTAQRIVDCVPLIPRGGALVGWAAAFVHGVDTFDGLHPHTMVRRPVIVGLGSAVGRGQRAEVSYSRERLRPDEVMTVHGIPVTKPLRTAFDISRWAADLTEAVVALDAVQQFGLVDIGDVAAYGKLRSGWKGIPLVRAALQLTVAGVRSPWESRARMLYEVEAGLPRPLVNPAITSLDGTQLAIVDLLDPEAALVTEFDGADHRERQQHSDDNVREELLEGCNLVVVRMDSLMMRRDRRTLIDRLRDGHQRGRRRDRSRDRWRLAP